ncbi:MAG: Lin0368 family putative glycerol transporter subunit [Bacillota bacterium]
MKNLSTIIGGAIAGIFVMSVWGKFAESYGIAGGWFAALIIIGTMWFLNHHIGILHNPPEGAWVDMALAIAVCGTLRPVFSAGSLSPLIDSMPTLVVVIIGGIAGGIAAAGIQKDIAREKR